MTLTYATGIQKLLGSWLFVQNWIMYYG